MKKYLQVFISIAILGFITSGHTVLPSNNGNSMSDEDPFMYLYCNSIDVTNDVIYFNGTSPEYPYDNDIEIIVSNGNWNIEYRTSAAQDHIALSEEEGSSDAIISIWPDGTPGTYILDFYLDFTLMASLTIEVE